MKSLDDLDALVREAHEFPYPALIKPLENLRAQFVLDIAPFRHLVLTLEQSLEIE